MMTAVVLLGLVLAPPMTDRWRPPELRVREGPPAIDFDEVRDLAFAYLDRPYVMGGVGSPAFDCSGFVCRVYAEAGYAIPRVSRDQARAGVEVPLDALEPGDLVFFAEEGAPISHVGMFIGDGQLVHASSGSGRVVVSNFNARWFQERLVRARRLLPTPVAGIETPARRDGPRAGAAGDAMRDTSTSSVADAAGSSRRTGGSGRSRRSGGTGSGRNGSGDDARARERASVGGTGSGGTGASGRAAPRVARRLAPAPVTELEEHAGAFALPITLRLPARQPAPSTGPDLPSGGETSVSVRSAIVTEAGSMGLVIAPEARLYLESIALLAELAVPVRFDSAGDPNVGTLDRTSDYARFIRTLSLGLRGADLELRLSRLGDLTLLEGYVLSGLAPASAATGVPGLAIASTPLSFLGHYRGARFEIEALLDDVIDPGLIALGVSVPVRGTRLRVGGAVSTDQRGRVFVSAGADPADPADPAGDATEPRPDVDEVAVRRALWAAELQANLDLVKRARWSVEMTGHAAMLRAVGGTGFGAGLRLLTEHRFGRHVDNAFTLTLTGGYLGARFIETLFGPTHVASREAHTAALQRVEGRLGVGGRLGLRVGRVHMGIGFADATSEARDPLDQQLEGLLAITDLPLGGARFVDLRLVYAARAPFSDGSVREDVIHGSVVWRPSSWLSAEAYLERGVTLEGGAGVTLRWAP